MGNTQYGFGSPALMTGSVLCLQKIFPLTLSKYQIIKVTNMKSTKTQQQISSLTPSNYQSYRCEEKHSRKFPPHPLHLLLLLPFQLVDQHGQTVQ